MFILPSNVRSTLDYFTVAEIFNLKRQYLRDIRKAKIPFNWEHSQQHRHQHIRRVTLVRTNVSSLQWWLCKPLCELELHPEMSVRHMHIPVIDTIDDINPLRVHLNEIVTCLSNQGLSDRPNCTPRSRNQPLSERDLGDLGTKANRLLPLTDVGRLETLPLQLLRQKLT
ncbi:hypothetical protein ACU8KH_03405 [Lachancea thermotolerans]